jgi:hypothetical protein
MNRPLTGEEQHELDALNAAVADAITARRNWLDAKIRETSQLQVGDDIYDVTSGQKVGRVTGLYRFWRDRDDGIRDDSHYCEYEYEVAPGCRDNTSRQSGRSFGTQEDALTRLEARVARLRR